MSTRVDRIKQVRIQSQGRVLGKFFEEEMTMHESEWDLSKRIDNLEEKIKDIEGQVPSDMLLPIALTGFIYAFIALSLHHPKYARKLKDELISTMRVVGLNKRVLDVLEEKLLIPLVDELEQMNEKRNGN